MHRIVKLIYFTLALLLFGVILQVVSQNIARLGLTNEQVSKFNFRYIKNEAFGFGERFDYNVGYKFIVAGTGYLQIASEPVFRYGRECYNIQFEVRSLESLDWLYRVRDIYTTIMDVGGIFPWEFTQKIREGNYKRDSKAYFDHVNRKSLFQDSLYDIPEYVQDILSAFYYTRTLDLGSMKKGQIFYLKNYFDGKTYDLGIKIHGKQTTEVDAGKFRCIVVEPMIVEGGLFKADGSIYIWLTDDERKMPVKVAAKIPIGFVEAKLTKYRGLRGPLKAKIE